MSNPRLNSTILVKRYIIGYKKKILLLISVVILALTFFCSTAILFISILANEKMDREEDYGSYDFIVAGITQAGRETANVHNYIDRKGWIRIIGNASAGNGVYVGSMDKQAVEMAKIKVLKGRMPSKDNEIAIEATTLQKLGFGAEPGDKITIDITGIISRGDSNSKTTNDKFVVTGILDKYECIRRNEQELGIGDIGLYPGLVVPSGTVKRYLNQKYTIMDNMVYSLKEGISPENAKEKIHIESIYGDISIENTIHFQMISWKSGDDTNIATGLIFICLVAVCMALVISNSFFITIDEREKHIGILRAVGATSKQVRNLVFGEAAVILASAIPFGVLISLGITKFALNIFGKITGRPQMMVVSLPVLLGACLIALLSVALASYLPAIRAGKLTPVRAISGKSHIISGEDKTAGGWLNTSRASDPSFWKDKALLVKLGIKNIARNKGRAFLVTAMITMSLAVFMFIYTSVSIFYKNIESHRLTGGSAYDFRIQQSAFNPKVNDSGLSAEYVAEIGKLKGVREINAYKTLPFSICGMAKNKLPVQVWNSGIANLQLQSEVTDLFQKAVGDDIQPLNLDVRAIPEKMMKLVGGEISGRNAWLYASDLIRSGFKTGDSLVVGVIKAKDGIKVETQEINITGVIDTLPGNMPKEIKEGITLFINGETYRELSDNDLFNEIYVYSEKNTDFPDMEKQLNLIATKGNNITVDSLWETTRKYESDNMKGRFMGYSLCVVVAILAVSMYLNSMYAAVLARKTEFAVMRAVGMTKNQLIWIIGTETFIYGVISCAASLLICLKPLSYVVQSEGYLFPGDIAWRLFIFVFLLNIIIGQLASKWPLKKVFSDGIIDSMNRVGL